MRLCWRTLSREATAVEVEVEAVVVVMFTLERGRFEIQK
jgi:hypothetical protein